MTTYREKLAEITRLLLEMGYAVDMKQVGNNAAKVDINAVDSANNTVQMLGVSALTVDEALTTAQRYHRTYMALHNKGVQNILARINALSPEDKKTLFDGLMKLSAEKRQQSQEPQEQHEHK